MAAAAQGITPTDADLAAVQAFLGALLPALGEIEEGNEVGVAPTGFFLPESEAR
jgi:hypothetical protein